MEEIVIVQVVPYTSSGGASWYLIQDTKTGLYFSQGGECDKKNPEDAWKFRYRWDAKTQARIKNWTLNEDYL